MSVGGESAGRRGAVAVLETGGQLGRDLLAVDWSATPLGPPEGWPPSLVLVLRTMLGSRFAMWMGWGPELSFFCNDAYRHDTLGLKYPWALGKPSNAVWAEIWDDIGPRIESVLRSGRATWDEALLLHLERSGFREETYHTFSYSALADDAGDVVGMLCVVAEETERVIGARRIGALNEVASSLAGVQDSGELERRLTHALGQHAADLPFTLTYLRGDGGAGSGAARLVSATGRARWRPRQLPISATEPWPIARALEGTVTMPLPADGDGPATAVLVPLAAPGREGPAGVLVAGLSPLRPADGDYVKFVELVAGQVASAVANARAYEDERRRSEQLAELDRAKTAFFTNVSHEFRTPLTLMLGPLADVLSGDDPGLSGEQRERIALAERNGKRLLALVNTLLDFNRLQAGRMQASPEPVDLALETAEIAGMFRSAIEQGGVELVVDCPAGAGPVEIDRRWWEQIVTNLVSNAFKHTFTGSIGVRLRVEGGHAELVVRDTGVGIPETELPRVFERFHRVEGGPSRSVEGSGIGLAFVRELVEALGGEITLESRSGRGTAVRVCVPVPPAAAQPAAAAGRVRETAEARIAEARGWIAAAAPAGPDGGEHGASDTRPSVLVVDDNADMRAYLVRLLGRRYDARSAADGAIALRMLREARPDIVLSDVMMPEIDGYELLRRVRGDPDLGDLPFVLLSARAGAESTVEGLDLGADDYLVKPFTAEELLGRVAARISGGAERRQRQAVAQLAHALTRAGGVDDVVRAFYACARDGFGAMHASVGLIDEDGETLRFWHPAPLPGGIAARYHRAALDSPLPSAVAAREGAVVTVGSREQAAGYGHVAGDWEVAGVHAEIVVPLVRANGERFGAISTTWSAERTFAPAEVELFEQMTSLALDTLERLRAARMEHRILERLQERLLEVDLRVPLATVAVRYRPADEALLLGGDWYDLLSLHGGRLGISLGDVVGHGLPAATIMGQLRSALGVAATTEDSPAAAMTAVADYARRVRGADGTTLVYAVLEPDGGLTWCSAGHVPPLLHDGGRPRYLSSPQRPILGATGDGEPQTGRAALPPGGLLLLYTDGLVERRGEIIDSGLERLRRAVERHAHLPVGSLCDALIAELTPEAGFDDDVALVAVRPRGQTPARLVDVFRAEVAEIPRARDRLRGWLNGLGVATAEVEEVLLAAGEAVANAIEHGSRLDARRIVSTEATVHAGDLWVAIGDSGTWDADSTAGPASGRGRGFQFMDAVMHDVQVHRDRVGTTVTLRRRLGGEAGTHAGG